MHRLALRSLLGSSHNALTSFVATSMLGEKFPGETQCEARTTRLVSEYDASNGYFLFMQSSTKLTISGLTLKA